MRLTTTKPRRFATSAARAVKVIPVMALLLTPFVVIGQSGTASASTCSDGDRQAAAAVGSNMVSLESVYSQGSSGIAKIELRFDKGSGCVWGLVSAAKDGSEIWLDRTDNKGLTWAGHLGVLSVSSGNGSTYTGLFNFPGTDTTNDWMRACGNEVDGPVVCTRWWRQ
jgi:hypothetical protein